MNAHTKAFLKFVFIFLDNKDIYCISKTQCMISVFICHEVPFIFCCSNSTCFTNYVLKFKYQPFHVKVKWAGGCGYVCVWMGAHACVSVNREFDLASLKGWLFSHLYHLLESICIAASVTKNNFFHLNFCLSSGSVLCHLVQNYKKVWHRTSFCEQ